VAQSGRSVTPVRIWLALGALALLVLGLGGVVAVLLLRPAPTTPHVTGETPRAEQPPVAASPAPSQSPPMDRGEQTRYRAYLTTTITGGSAVAGALAGLKDCEDGRAVCMQRLGEARDQVGSFEQALDANPAPSCLSTTDDRLRDALTLQDNALSLAQQGITAKNRLRMAQALLLIGVSGWREGQAIVAARQSSC